MLVQTQKLMFQKRLEQSSQFLRENKHYVLLSIQGMYRPMLMDTQGMLLYLPHTSKRADVLIWSCHSHTCRFSLSIDGASHSFSESHKD